MAFVFDTTRFPDVRAAIGLDIDEAMLPDSTLALPIYKSATERYINENLTATQVTAKPELAQYAASLYLASLVVPSLRFVQSERIVGGNISYVPINVEEKVSQLVGLASGAIADAQGEGGAPPDTTASDLNYFGLAHRRW
jgi:hypothetical protein